MIVGIGVDLVEVARMDRLLRRVWAGRFLARVFSEEEIAWCEKSPHPAQAYSARFASKEACVKALGTGFSSGISPANIRIDAGNTQQPKICLTGAALKKAESMHVGSVHLSMSHTPTIVCAVVVVIKNMSDY